MPTLHYAAAERGRFIRESREAVAALLGLDGSNGPPEWHCLGWAAVLARMLRRAGRRAALVAGSCGWPRLRPDQDDGRPETSTHFSHMFVVDEALPLVVRGLAPEWHCWVAMAGRGDAVELIDGTTGAWPEKCRRLSGTDWPGDRPRPPVVPCRRPAAPRPVRPGPAGHRLGQGLRRPHARRRAAGAPHAGGPVAATGAVV
jgi:hypothetical protein